MPKFKTALLAFAVGAALCAPAVAQWKWRDESGRVQYSDLPPPAGVSEAQILQRPNQTQRKSAPAVAAAASSSPPASAPAITAGKDRRARTRGQAPPGRAGTGGEEEGEDEKQAAARADNCARAKSHMRALEDGMRLSRVNVKGEREILDGQGTRRRDCAHARRHQRRLPLAAFAARRLPACARCRSRRASFGSARSGR